MRLLLLFLAGFLSAQARLSSSPVGTWTNVDEKTRGVTQIIVRLDGQQSLIHAWGSCIPTDCDWGETKMDVSEQIPSATWDAGSLITRMQIVPQPDGRLLIICQDEINAGGVHKLPPRVEFFARQQPHQDSPEETAARNLTKVTAEMYRGIKSARFESTEILETLAGKSEERSKSGRTLLFLAPDRLYNETRGTTKVSTVIDDGKTEWQILPRANVYTSAPQAKDISSALLYTHLDQRRAIPRITGHESFEGHTCTIIHFDLGRGSTQDLWIDDMTHLVQKDLQNDPAQSPPEASRRHDTVYTLSRINEQIDPSAFTYDPAKTQAQNRRENSGDAPVSLLGKAAPDFAARDLNHREVHLADLRGKAVLLDFWGTWCAYCREALPTIELLHRAGQPKGLKVLGVDAEEPGLARQYLARSGYTLPSLVDSGEVISGRYHVESWPTTVLIDQKGYVAYYGDGAPEKLREALQKLGVW